jgi:hypothetical protein
MKDYFMGRSGEGNMKMKKKILFLSSSPVFATEGGA